MNSDTGSPSTAIHQVRGAAVAVQAAAHGQQLELSAASDGGTVTIRSNSLLERRLGLLLRDRRAVGIAFDA